MPGGENKAAQNAAQRAHAELRMESLAKGERAKFDVKRGVAGLCEASMGRAGPEHSPLALSKAPISANGGAESDARDAPQPVADPDLSLIHDRWANLPEHIKAAVLALIRSASDSKRRASVQREEPQ